MTGTELARLQRQAAARGHSTRLDLFDHLPMTVAVFGCGTRSSRPTTRYPVAELEQANARVAG